MRNYSGLIRVILNRIKISGKQKIFCIGLNKTGTTSLKKEMELQGYVVGNQRLGELLFDDWVRRDFRRIIRLCKTAQFFQDAPFSFPYTYIALDQTFPGSKFILTVRDDGEEWYNSLVNFHSKSWGNGNIPPTWEDLKESTYIYKGFPYHFVSCLFNSQKNDLYNKDKLIKYYNLHCSNVLTYFKYRPDDLFVINLKNNDSYSKFCNFLQCQQVRDSFPWLNKTSNIVTRKRR